MGGEQFFAQSEPSWPLWTSGIEHPIDSWNGNPFFVPIQPGETKTFTVLHVVAASDLADPTFSYHYRNTSYGGNVPHRRFDPSLGRSAAQPPLPCAALSFLPVPNHRRSLRGFEAARTPPAKRIRSNELFRFPQNNLTL